MRILHIIDSINVQQGGPSVSVPALAAAQAKQGHRVTIACRDYGYLGPMAKAEGVEVRSVPSSRWTKGQGGWGGSFRRLVEQEAEKADVVHNHGLWLAANYYARRAAGKAGKPLVISPRGMLEGWSLGRSIVRKAVAWHLFERKNLESAALFHATSESEAEAIATALCSKLKFKNQDGSAKGDRRQEIEDRKTDNPPNSYLLSTNSFGVPRIVVAGEDSESQGSVGPRSTAAGEVWPRRSGALQSDSSWPRMVVAPNGVDIPERIPKREVLERRFPELKGRRWVLFMSRIHPKKGVDLLLKAWNQLASDSFRIGDWGLGIEGKDKVESEKREEGGSRRSGVGSHPSSISDLPSTNSAPALVIAGPEEDRGYAEKLKKEGGREVVWTGELRGEEKWAALGQAEFLVLPSHSENFGIVVAESLAAGRPAVTTKNTPWGIEVGKGYGISDMGYGGPSFAPSPLRGGAMEGGCAGGTMNLEERKCGVICEVTDLRRGLERMLEFSDKERMEMGARGREWMKEEFSWEAGAEKLTASYKKILRSS